MKDKTTAIIYLCGEKHTASVIKGERYIDGETIESFINKMSNNSRWDIIFDLATIGIKNITNDLTFNSCQEEANMLYSARTKYN